MPQINLGSSMSRLFFGSRNALKSTWRGILIEIRYRPPFAHFYRKHPIAYLEVVSVEPKGVPLPITKTGYVSLVVEGIRIEAAGGPASCVRAWLDHDAEAGEWNRRRSGLSE
jgi:hypothetical protein